MRISGVFMAKLHNQWTEINLLTTIKYRKGTYVEGYEDAQHMLHETADSSEVQNLVNKIVLFIKFT
jgi:hypothetical protein